MVDKSSEFYNRSMKSWLEKNDIDMYSIHNEGKFQLLLKDVLEFLKIDLETYDCCVKKYVY